jgi:hypothetical protein
MTKTTCNYWPRHRASAGLVGLFSLALACGDSTIDTQTRTPHHSSPDADPLPLAAPAEDDIVELDYCGGDDEGAERACYSGPVATRGVGQCSDGIQTCNTSLEFAVWSDCSGEVLPAPTDACGEEGLGDGVDNDCDGETDEGCLEPAAPEPSNDSRGCGAFSSHIGSALCGVNYNTGKVQPLGTILPLTKLGGTGTCPQSATCTGDTQNSGWSWDEPPEQAPERTHGWSYQDSHGPSCVSLSDYQDYALPAPPIADSPCTPLRITGGLQFVYNDCVQAGTGGRTCAAGNAGRMWCRLIDTWFCH